MKAQGQRKLSVTWLQEDGRANCAFLGWITKTASVIHTCGFFPVLGHIIFEGIFLPAYVSSMLFALYSILACIRVASYFNCKSHI